MFSPFFLSCYPFSIRSFIGKCMVMCYFVWSDVRLFCFWDCFVSCIWQEFQACHALQDSTDDGSIDKVETSLEQQELSLSSKIRLMHFLLTSIFPFACESWTLTAELQRRILAMEMRCYSKILRISYTDHVTNKEVRAKIQQAIRPYEDLTIIKRCKLKWYGHVSQSSGQAKPI